MGTYTAVAYAKLRCGYLKVKYLIIYLKYLHMI